MTNAKKVSATICRRESIEHLQNTEILMLELLEEHAMPHQTPVGVFHADTPNPPGLMRDNSTLQLDGFVAPNFLPCNDRSCEVGSSETGSPSKPVVKCTFHRTLIACVCVRLLREETPYVDSIHIKRKTSDSGRQSQHAAAVGVARHTGDDGHEIRLRHGIVRRLHGTHRRGSHALLRYADFDCFWKENHHH